MRMSFVYKNQCKAERHKYPHKTQKAPLRRLCLGYYRERAFSFALSKAFGGSLTIEAALILPIFMLFVTAILSFLIIINLQTGIQLRMEEAARQLGKSAYALKEGSDSLGNLFSDESDSDTNTGSILNNGINALTIRASVLDSDLCDKINSSGITDKTAGISVSFSEYDEESGILDIVLSYRYALPYLSSDIAQFSFTQRSLSRAWIGKSLVEANGLSGEEDGDTIVYVTPTGTVYHTSAECHYLDLSIHSVPYSSVDSQRNSSGAKYERCSGCCSSEETYSTVYITDYGTNYHSSLTCSGLKRTVMEVKLSEVGDMRVCSKCGGSH